VNHQEVTLRLAAALNSEPGWERRLEHHFRHLATGVDLTVYETEVAVIFGPIGDRHSRTVSAGTNYFPADAVASVLEVARALVATRTTELGGFTLAEVTDWRAAVAKASATGRSTWTLICPADGDALDVTESLPQLPTRCLDGHVMVLVDPA
jgi:hypothetical protein